MGTIRKVRTIAVDPGLAWDALSDWEGLAERLAQGFVVDVTMTGHDRIVTFFNQMVVRERIVSSSADDRRLVWTVVDGPFDHYNGAATVTDGPGEKTTFTWISDLLPNDHLSGIDDMMERGIETIKKTLESSTTRTWPR